MHPFASFILAFTMTLSMLFGIARTAAPVQTTAHAVTLHIAPMCGSSDPVPPCPHYMTGV